VNTKNLNITGVSGFSVGANLNPADPKITIN
jgi:hypothetical protein